MEIKNLQSLITECISYADEVSKNPEVYPATARMPLKDLLRYDLITFFGYLYEPGCPELPDQIEFIKSNLLTNISEDKFEEFVSQKCDDESYFNKVPQAINFFIIADKKSMDSNDISIAKSKFIVDCYRKLGEGFINYEKVKPETKDKLYDYIGFLNNTLKTEGVVKVRRYGDEEETPKEKPIIGVQNVSTFDEETGRFVTKKKIQTSGHNLIKKKASDVSEFSNFIKEEVEESKTKRGNIKVGGNRHDDLSDEIEKSLDDLIKDLQDLIGLASVKDDLMHIINIIKVRKLREMKGYKCPEMSFHLVFTGNPGTGKTTVARLLAKIYKQLGVVSRGQFVEVDRSGLVDHVPGGTAIKTSQVIDRAVGGILFIDEAYALTYHKEMGDYGQEAVDTLLKRMEDDREDLIVIVAGYPEPMRKFVDSNPGLRSRFNKYINFQDYSTDELMRIFRYMCKENDYMLTESAAFIAETYFKGIVQTKQENFANARMARNYFERCVDRQASRLVQDPNMNEDDLITFVREDMIESGTDAASGLLGQNQENMLPENVDDNDPQDIQVSSINS